MRYSTRVFACTASEEEDEVITVSSNLLQEWPGLIKRGLDLAIALPATVALLPFGLVIGFLVRFTSAGPAIFAQERVGLNKRIFRLLKFRTMQEGAEQRQEDLHHLNRMDGPVFKVDHDPRVTPLGRFLRRWSLDELPQLLNVLRGEMSLVGPRPLPLVEHRRLPESWQLRRCSVRPGLTGLWQVSGRSDLDFQEWMRLDMTYIDRWSLSLDWRILLRTTYAVLRGRGAM